MGPVGLRRIGNIMVGFGERNTRNRRGKISGQRPSAHSLLLFALLHGLNRVGPALIKAIFAGHGNAVVPVCTENMESPKLAE